MTARCMDDSEARICRKLKEQGMPLKEIASLYGVHIATLCRELARLRAQMGEEQIAPPYKNRSRPSLRSRLDSSENTANT